MSEGPFYLWDGKNCPHDDCDGDLVHQDGINVMCKQCDDQFVFIDGRDPYLVNCENHPVKRMQEGSA